MDNRPDRLKSFHQNIFPFEVERYPGVIASCGEDGCTRSHLAILKKQVDLPFVIFEDDCVLINSWDVVEKAMKQLPANWDMLYLGANPNIPLTRYSMNLYKLWRAWTTHAIIYGSHRVIDYVLKHSCNVPPGKNIDIFYCNIIQKKFNCFVTYPMVATQLSDYSDIAKKNTSNYHELITNYNKHIV